jgi:hypothetical protein
MERYKRNACSKIVMTKRHLHTGAICFKQSTPLKAIKAAAQSLAKQPEFVCVWVQRVDPVRWGIAVLTKCNSACNGTDIASEVGSWIEHIEAVIPKQGIGGVTASSEVAVFKMSNFKSKRSTTRHSGSFVKS